MVNLDMVGRPQGGKLYVQGAATAEGGRARAERLADGRPGHPAPRSPSAGDGYGPSDHTSFYAEGVPVVFLFTGAHGDYHRPSDTADKLDGARALGGGAARRAARARCGRCARALPGRPRPRRRREPSRAPRPVSGRAATAPTWGPSRISRSARSRACSSRP